MVVVWKFFYFIRFLSHGVILQKWKKPGDFNESSSFFLAEYAFEGPKDNTIFGNFHASNNIRPASDVFATLNPQAGNGNDSGLWTANQPNGAPEAKGQGAAEAKAEDEKPRFEYGIPAFLRKKN